MTKVAEAMGCEVIYGVVPADGATLEETADRRKWKGLLGVKD